MDVSILARPVGRALPTSLAALSILGCFNPRPSCGTGATLFARMHRGKYLCFNPRPSCGTGATEDVWWVWLVTIVSILARPVGRALR